MHIRTSAVVLFSLAAVLILASIVADRLGAPPQTTATFILALGVLCIGIAGLLSATMRVSTYQAAGHALSLPLLAATVTTLSLGLSAAMSKGAPGLDPAAIVVLAAAALIHACSVAGALARAGGYSFGDVIHARFNSRAIAVIVALAGFAIALALLVTIGPKAVIGLAQALHLPRHVAVALVAGLACLVVLPGGARGLAAASGIVVVLALVGWALPSTALLAETAAMRGDLVEQATGFFGAISPSLDGVGWVMAALGLLTCLHGPAVTRDAVVARQGLALGVVAMLALGILAAGVHGITDIATARLATIPADKLPARMFGPDARGEVTFCGATVRGADDLRRACALASPSDPVPAARIVVARPEGGRWQSLVLRQPVAIGAVYDLVLPILLIVAFALIAHLSARFVVHDILYRLTGRAGTSSGRLAMQRLIAACLIIGVAIGLPLRLVPDLAGAVGKLVVFTAAAVPWPLALLARWKRADWRAALCGLASAAIAGAALWFGYLPGAEGFVAGALASLVAGALAALLFPARDDGSAHAGDVLAGRAPGPLVLDKSA